MSTITLKSEVYLLLNCFGTPNVSYLSDLFTRKKTGFSVKSSFSKVAAKYGQLDVLQWLKDNNFPLDKDLHKKAFNHKHFELFDWLEMHGGNRDLTQLCCIAVQHGDTELLQIMKDEGYSASIIKHFRKIFFSAINGGNIETLVWLKENFQLKILDCPAPNLEVYQWLLSNGYECSNASITQTAAETGNLEMLKWLKENGVIFPENIIDHAFVNSNLELIKWLKEIGYEMNKFNFFQAIRQGNIHILDWMKEFVYQNISPSDFAHYFTFPACHVKTLQWVKDNNLFDINQKEYFKTAVSSGNIEVMNWAIQNGYICNDESIITYIPYKNIEVLEWMKNNNPVFNSQNCINKLQKNAGERDYVPTLKWFQDNGYKKNIMASQGAIYQGNFYILKWLKRNDWPIDDTTFYNLFKYHYK